MCVFRDTGFFPPFVTTLSHTLITHTHTHTHTHSHTVMATAEGSSQVTYDHIFKIILIGDNGVGKSSFIRRFCEGSYVADMETTIGVDFYLSEIDVNGKKIKVCV